MRRIVVEIGSETVFVGFFLLLIASVVVAQANRLLHQGGVGRQPPVLRAIATIAILSLVIWGAATYRWYVTPLALLVASILAGALMARWPLYPWVKTAPIFEIVVILGAAMLWALRYS
jgi:hypothetical protein